MPKGTAKRGQTVRAVVKGQAIAIDIAEGGPTKLTLRLSDALLDLDKQVTVTVNGKRAFQGTVKRTLGPIWHSLRERGDPRAAASATLDLELK